MVKEGQGKAGDAGQMLSADGKFAWRDRDKSGRTHTRSHAHACYMAVAPHPLVMLTHRLSGLFNRINGYGLIRVIDCTEQPARFNKSFKRCVFALHGEDFYVDLI